MPTGGLQEPEGLRPGASSRIPKCCTSQSATGTRGLGVWGRASAFPGLLICIQCLKVTPPEVPAAAGGTAANSGGLKARGRAAPGREPAESQGQPRLPTVTLPQGLVYAQRPGPADVAGGVVTHSACLSPARPPRGPPHTLELALQWVEVCPTPSHAGLLPSSAHPSSGGVCVHRPHPPSKQVPLGIKLSLRFPQHLALPHSKAFFKTIAPLSISKVSFAGRR